MDGSCLNCGAEVPPKRGTGPRPSYCTKTCQHQATYSRAKARGSRPSKRSRAPKVCPVCSVEFVPAKSAKQKYCTPKCARAVGQDSKTKVCSMTGCDAPMRAKGLCAKHWRRKARAEGREKVSEWTPERRAAWKARETAKRMTSTEVEPVVFEDICERDRWTCQLCSDPVDPTLAYPHPLSKSQDHIVPLSKDGGHIESNVQLAHLVCNLQKGARVAA